MRRKSVITVVCVALPALLLAACGEGEKAIGALQDNVKKLETAVAAVTSKAGVAAKKAAALEDANTLLKGKVVALESKIARIEAHNAKIVARAAGLEARAKALDGRTAALDGKAKALDGKTAALQGLTVKLDGRTAKLEGVVTSLKANYAMLEGGVTKATTGVEDAKKELTGLKRRWNVPASWSNCAWKDVGEKESRSPSRDWCPAGQVMTAINLAACAAEGQSCPPTIAKVKCCSTR